MMSNSGKTGKRQAHQFDTIPHYGNWTQENFAVIGLEQIDVNNGKLGHTVCPQIRSTEYPLEINIF